MAICVLCSLRACLIFLPALDFEFIDGDCGKGSDESRCQPGVGEKRDIEVDGGAAYLSPVAQFCAGEVSGHIHHEVHLAVVEQVERLGFAVGSRRPVDLYSRDAVFVQELAGSAGRVDCQAGTVQHMGGLEHIGLLFGRACAQQHRLFRNSQAYSQEAFEDCLIGVVAYAATSPVDAMSTPRTGSAPPRREKLNWEAFTPT